MSRTYHIFNKSCVKYKSNLFVLGSSYHCNSVSLGLYHITKCFIVWSADVRSVQGYRNYSFEFCVPYGLTVETATNSLVWGQAKFIFIFKIKRSVQQDLCSIG